MNMNGSYQLGVSRLRAPQIYKSVVRKCCSQISVGRSVLADRFSEPPLASMFIAIARWAETSYFFADSNARHKIPPKSLSAKGQCVEILHSHGPRSWPQVLEPNSKAAQVRSD